MPSVYEGYLRRYLNDNGTLWSSAQIERWALRAEQEIGNVQPAVSHRCQLPTIERLPLYQIPPANSETLPSLGINQITYRGDYVTPLSLQQAHDLFPTSVITETFVVLEGAFEVSAFSNTAFYVSKLEEGDASNMAFGKPEFWWYSGYEEKTIQLYPAPNETINYDASVSSAALWSSNALGNFCVVEYRTFSTPSYKPHYRLIRQLIRDFVLSEAFAVEGKGQQIKESVMLKKRFKARLNAYKALASNVFVANKHTVGNQVVPARLSFKRLNFGNDIGIRTR